MVFKEVPADKTSEPVQVQEYQLSRLGVTLALISKAQFDDNKDQVYDEIYNDWSLYFDDHPFSLDKFCKKYFYLCKESKLFNKFVEYFIEHAFNVRDIYSSTDLFTQMIFLRFDNDDSKNEKLNDLWKEAILSLDEHNVELFLNHIKIHINRLIEKKVHNFAKYEVKRYENRDHYNLVTIEGTCLNCSNEYVYLSIPIVLYIPYLLYNGTHSELHMYTRNIKCQKCKNSKFDFVLI